MGSVWLAEHLTLRTQVAVKFMSERLAQDPEYVQRFSREAMSSAQIKSPHVVQVFDYGISADGTPFIVMELLEGEDLRVRLSRVGTISVEEAAVIASHLSRALSKAHALGIVHRDIKPDNVFLTDQDGELFVKVLDFGIAKHAAGSSDALDGMTGTGAMVGTPHYMSPEQILSARRVDHRADLWSVGVVLYRALTGQVPFQGETLGAVCVAIERGTFAPLSQRRPGLPITLDAWFQRALARDPAMRFQSAKELADGFVAALGAGGPPALQAPYRLETTSARIPPPTGFALASTPPPAGTSGAAWAMGATPAPLVGTNSAMVGGSLGPDSAMSKSGAHHSFVEPPWSASGAGHPQPQTFHGSSVTHAEWKSSSRRAMVTVVSAVLGVVVLIAIGVAILLKGGPEATAETAAASPSSVVATAAPPPSAYATQAPVVMQAPPPQVSASSSATGSSAPKATTTTPATTTTTTTGRAATTSAGRPKRDRGF